MCRTNKDLKKNVITKKKDKNFKKITQIVHTTM